MTNDEKMKVIREAMTDSDKLTPDTWVWVLEMMDCVERQDKQIRLLKAIRDAAQTFRETTEQWFGEMRGEQFVHICRALDAYDKAQGDKP